MTNRRIPTSMLLVAVAAIALLPSASAIGPVEVASGLASAVAPNCVSATVAYSVELNWVTGSAFFDGTAAGCHPGATPYQVAFDECRGGPGAYTTCEQDTMFGHASLVVHANGFVEFQHHFVGKGGYTYTLKSKFVYARA